mgnify:CR=1 FL=1
MIIDKSVNKECNKCKGKGVKSYCFNSECTSHKEKCESCNGTGIYKDEYYIIVANGIAFDSDMRGK